MFRLATFFSLVASAMLFAGPALAQTASSDDRSRAVHRRTEEGGGGVSGRSQSAGVRPVRADDVQPGSHEHCPRDG